MKMLKSNKGLSFGDMAPLAIAFIVTVVVIAIGATVLGSINATQTANSYEDNITSAGLSGLDTFGDNFPVLAVVIVGAILLGILTTAFVATR